MKQSTPVMVNIRVRRVCETRIQTGVSDHINFTVSKSTTFAIKNSERSKSINSLYQSKLTTTVFSFDRLDHQMV